MRTSKENPIREAVTPPLPVNKKEKVSEHLKARQLVDALLPQYSPHFHKVITNELDRVFVIAWYRYGKTPGVRQHVRSTLFTPLDHLRPLGHVCILALAMGLLNLPLPEGIQSTQPSP